jgi:3-phosphoshikimate 1-carboxyvinyltransferase
VEPGPIGGGEVEIEPDLSNAAPFLAAALIAGGRVSITGWPATTTQVGDSLREILPRYGAEVRLEEDLLTVLAPGIAAGRLPAVDLDLSEGGELAPTFAALAALGAAPAELDGIGHLRGHETDRLSALVHDLEIVGVRAVALDDGLLVRADATRELRGGRWACYGDHRMATTGALIGLAVDGVELDDVATTSKTLPEFPELWAALVASGGRA